MKKVKIPFTPIRENVPFIKFRLKDGTEGTAVVDTGSEATFFDKDFVEEHKDQFNIFDVKGFMNVVGIGDNKSVKLQYIETDLCFDDMRIPMFDTVPIDLGHISKQLGASIKMDALFGSDFLSYTNAKLDFMKKELILQYENLSCK